MYQFLQARPRLSQALDFAASIFIANLLALLAAFPLVTLPPSIAALFSYTARLARSEEGDLMRDFAGAIRSLFITSWLIVIVDVAVWALVGYNLYLIESFEIPLGGVIGSALLVVAIYWLIVNIYLWPLAAMVNLPFHGLLRLAIQLSLGHLPWGFVVLACALACIALTIYLPILMVIGMFATITYVVNAGAWRVIRRYVTAGPSAQP